MNIPFENHNTELKEKLNDSLVKEIVSFLNTFDGKIYIGINKQRKVVGISENNNKDKLDEVLRKISDIITDQISPRCVEYVSVNHIVIDGKDVAEISVNKGKELYYIKKYGLSEKGCYIREGTSTKSLTPEEIKQRYIGSINVKEVEITDIPSVDSRRVVSERHLFRAETHDL